MSDVLLLVLAGACLLVVLVAITIVQERRTVRRFEKLACPKCGAIFGCGSYSSWHTHTRFAWYCRWNSGPLMTCKQCNRKLRLTWVGQLHAEQFENMDVCEASSESI